MANINFDVAEKVIFDNIKGVKTYIYRDLGTKNFTTQYIANTKNLETNININTVNTSAYDVQAIKNSINNIFKFIPGQEILDPQFGNTLYHYLYKPIIPEMVMSIKSEVIALLNKYQPRINIDNIKIETSAEQFLIKIILYYSIANINGAFSTQVEF